MNQVPVPTGLLNLERNKFVFKHVLEHVIRVRHKRHNFFRQFVTLLSLKVPSGAHL